MMISPRARSKAKSFTETHLQPLGLSKAVLRQVEKDLARSFQGYRDDIASFVGNSFGIKQWIDTSRAIEVRIRKLM